MFIDENSIDELKFQSSLIIEFASTISDIWCDSNGYCILEAVYDTFGRVAYPMYNAIFSNSTNHVNFGIKLFRSYIVMLWFRDLDKVDALKVISSG